MCGKTRPLFATFLCASKWAPKWCTIDYLVLFKAQKVTSFYNKISPKVHGQLFSFLYTILLSWISISFVFLPFSLHFQVEKDVLNVSCIHNFLLACLTYKYNEREREQDLVIPPLLKGSTFFVTNYTWRIYFHNKMHRLREWDQLYLPPNCILVHSS